MIEFVRFFLAFIVVVVHLTNTDGWMAQQAVFAFYTLSGYLITRVLNERYGFSTAGFSAFALNRFLRLWPAYLIVLTLTMAAAAVVPIGEGRIPRTPTEIITALTILGQVTIEATWWPGGAGRPVLTSWSLSIEIVCYLMLALYFAKSPARLYALALLGFFGITASTGACVLSSNPAQYGPYCFMNRYGVIQAGFIPFAAGGLTYFYRDLLSRVAQRNPVAIAGTLIVLDAICARSDFFAFNLATFIGIGAIGFTVLLCEKDGRQSNTEDFFGRASYHLFIAHMSIAPVLAAVGMPTNTWKMVFVATAVSLALSVLLVPVERRVDILRRKISSFNSKTQREAPRDRSPKMNLERSATTRQETPKTRRTARSCLAGRNPWLDRST